MRGSVQVAGNKTPRQQTQKQPWRLEPRTPGRKEPQKEVSTFSEMEFMRRVAMITEHLPCGKEEGDKKLSVVGKIVPLRRCPHPNP